MHPREKIEAETRPWDKLPYELLELIAMRLAIIELLFFRGVCKNWRFSSGRATAKSPGTRPWLLMYDNNSKCNLFNQESKKSYTIDIPELNGVTCIASKGGWLLLQQENSMCFFCPLSRTKIHLPEFPKSEGTDHVGVFTSAPTSSDCLVGVISNYKDVKFELHMLERGANTWVSHVYECRSKHKVTSGVFSNGKFYFLGYNDCIITFALEDKEWESRVLVYDSEPTSATTEPFPFYIRKSYSEKRTIKEDLKLGKSDRLSICGTVVPQHSCNKLIHNEDLKAEEDNDVCYKKAVWLHPRFFQISSIQSWSI